MTTYYRLEVKFDGCWALAFDAEFTTQNDAEEFRDRLVVNPRQRIVKQGCPTRIVEVTERVVREFPGLPVEGEA
jgi:hypothetical protein